MMFIHSESWKWQKLGEGVAWYVWDHSPAVEVYNIALGNIYSINFHLYNYLSA